MCPVSVRDQEENNSKYRGQVVVRDKNTKIISFKLLQAIFNLVNAKNVKCMNVTLQIGEARSDILFVKSQSHLELS